MGVADRYYMRESPGNFNRSATVVLIVVLVVVFILQRIALPPQFTSDYLALSLDGLRQGFV